MRQTKTPLIVAAGLLLLFLVSSAVRAELFMEEETGEHGRTNVIIANELYRLVFEPARGGRCVSFQFRKTGRELIPVGHIVGMFMDIFAHQPWPGELLNSPYEYRIERDADQSVSLFLWTAAKGGADGRDLLTQGLRVEKRITLQAGRREVEVLNTFHNPTDAGRSVGLWTQHIFCYGGDRLFDLHYRPSSQGISLTGLDDEGTGHYLPGLVNRYAQDFVGASRYTDAGGRKVVAGWTAGRDRRTDEGAVFLMDYNYLQTLYNSSGSTNTTEWFMDAVPIPPGKSWSTSYTFIPVEGFTGFSHAGRRLIANTEVMPEADGVRIRHQFAGGVEAAGNIEVETRIRGSRTGKEVLLAPLTLVDVGLQPKAAEQVWDSVQSEPLVLHIAVRGDDWLESFAYPFEGAFAAQGIHGAGEMVEDIIVPPVKQKEFLRPDSWDRPKNENLRVLFVYGLYSNQYGIEEAVRKIDPDAEIEVAEGWSFFPATHDVLLQYDLIVLSNMEAGPDYANVMVDDVVRYGGIGLLALGGIRTFGGGQWRGTALGELLPGEISDPFDLKWERPGASVKTVASHPVTQGVLFPAEARFYWIHEMFPKPDSTVLLTAAARPLVLTATAGQGRVVAVAGTCHGDPDPEHVEAWRTTAWTQLLAQSMKWLRTGE